MNRTFAEKITSITTCALDKRDLHGIVDVLRNIALELDACGCILWETDPWAEITNDIHTSIGTGNLHVFARWICDEISMPLQELPLNESASGRAIIEKKTVTKEDIRTDAGTYKDNQWIFDVQMTSFCAVPIKFDADYYNGALCVHRRREIRPFTKEEQMLIEQIAGLIPPLYQAVRNRVGHDLLSKTNKVLERAERGAKDKEIEKKSQSDISESYVEEQEEDDEFVEITGGLQNICMQVAETFQCIETSLFLKNDFRLGGKFNLIATTHPEWTEDKEVYDSERDKNNHLTGWVLQNQKPVNIFDLGHFKRDREKIRAKYEGIEWLDLKNIKKAAGDILGLPENNLPTLSFMAVPVKKGDELLGVIRCCTAKKDPWFFADRQVKILELVASQISRFWSEWVQHLEEKREIETWKEFIKSVSKLNAKAQRLIGSAEADKIQLYEDLLKLARSSIKNSSVLDIRLVDGKTNELYFAKTLGFTKDKGSRSETDLKNKRFSLNKSSYTGHIPLGVSVFEKKEAVFIADAEIENYRSETFPETKRIIIAPIGVQDIRGLLDIRGTKNEPFPPNALQMATLLGQQLDLYLSLWESEKQQRQVLEDLWHQLKNPVRHIYRRADDLANDISYKKFNKDAEKIDYIRNKLLQLRGVSRKAKRVAVNAGIFKDLAAEREIEISSDKKNLLKSDEVVKMLIEAGKDTRLLLEEGEYIRFRIFDDGFKVLDHAKVRVNFDLLEQSVNCLFDNAAKYSLSDTSVEIRGGTESLKTSRYFYFSFRNKGCHPIDQVGYTISEDEVSELRKRYYRGKWARRTTGEGSGIGLWVVDNIMSAHKGRLDIFKTDINGFNEVRLVFPIGV